MSQVWQYTDSTNKVVMTTLPDGTVKSCLVTDQAYLDSIAAGGTTIAAAAPTRERLAEIAFGSGITITSTGTPSLNGTYPVDPASQFYITSVGASIAAGQGLPGGGSTIQIIDVNGAQHAFTSAKFLEFGSAVRDYVYAVELYASGASGSLPSSSVTIS